MDKYRKKAEDIMKRGDEYLAAQKHRKNIIIRDSAFLGGAAAVLGIGIFTGILKAPEKPAPEKPGIVSEAVTTSSGYAETNIITSTQTSKTSETVTENTTVPTTVGTNVSANTSQTTSTNAAVKSETSVTAVKVTEIVPTYTTIQTETVSSVNTESTEVSVTVTTSVVTSSTPETLTTKNINERITDIVIAFPTMADIVKDVPTIGEYGERIPTFPMIVGENDYMQIVKYEKGELIYSFDINQDESVDIYDMLEIAACLPYLDEVNQTGIAPQEIYDIYPDMNVYENVIASTYSSYNNALKKIKLLTEYMIYKGYDIPDSSELQALAKEYAGERPVSELSYQKLCETVKESRDAYYQSYSLKYEDLNYPRNIPEWMKKIFRKIDCEELFPDASHNGKIDYMDIYEMIRFYVYTSTNQSDCYTEEESQWMLDNCCLTERSDGRKRIDMRDVSILKTYLYYYKCEDYVTEVEMQLENGFL